MDWSDSVFREHVKYYGDVEFSKDVGTGDNGIVSSKKYLAFRYKKKIGILSTNFESNIAEKLAQGRRAEYGSKVYTTTKIDQIDVNDVDINVLQFDPFSDSTLYVGDSKGALTIYDIAGDNKSSFTVNDLSSSICSLASHPSSSDILAIGGDGNINLIDLAKGGESIINTKIAQCENDQIINMTFSENSNYLRCITKNKLLFYYDPRTDKEIENSLTLRYSCNNIVNLYKENEIAICGLTSFQEPIVYGYDISGKLSDKLHEGYLFKKTYSHKHCKPFIKYDRCTQILYIGFEAVADILCLNTINSTYEKQALYHSVDDTFMAFDILPKHSCKKREINRLIKFSKTRIQQIVHTRGGKLIYNKISSSPKKSISSANDYFEDKKNVSYPEQDLAVLVPPDFEEEKKRSVSLYIHVTGKEPQSLHERYYDLKISSTVQCNLGLNIQTNSKFALFPAPTYGGGALGVINVNKPGRKKQASLVGHGDKITTFDICRIAGNENLVITGSPDSKSIIHKIIENESNGNIVKCEKLFTVKCGGKVTFVAFHPRINNLCVMAANKEAASSCNVFFYDYKEGKVLKEIKLENTRNIMDIQFESIIGLIAAISCSKGIVKLLDIRNGTILKQFKSNTFARDTKLFWATNKGQNKPTFYNQLICLGFGTGSIRKFSLYDLTDVVTKYYDQNCIIAVDESKESQQDDATNKPPPPPSSNTNDENNDENKQSDDIEELEAVSTKSFGASNAIPIGYYDGNDNLIYISSVGDRKIRCYEFNGSNIKETNSSYQSKTDIQGISFISKQSVNAKKIELAKCYRLCKDGEISPVSFSIPRKRTEYFQDDLYSQVLDIFNKPLSIDICKEEDVFDAKSKSKINVDLTYLSLKPDDMELLSEAPEEQQSEYQKRRNSQLKALETQKLKEQPKSTEQAFDQFSRMVADAPTANRWDAQNIGTEVAEDEWSD